MCMSARPACRAEACRAPPRVEDTAGGRRHWHAGPRSSPRRCLRAAPSTSPTAPPRPAIVRDLRTAAAAHWALRLPAGASLSATDTARVTRPVRTCHAHRTRFTPSSSTPMPSVAVATLLRLRTRTIGRWTSSLGRDERRTSCTSRRPTRATSSNSTNGGRVCRGGGCRRCASREQARLAVGAQPGDHRRRRRTAEHRTGEALRRAQEGDRQPDRRSRQGRHADARPGHRAEEARRFRPGAARRRARPAWVRPRAGRRAPRLQLRLRPRPLRSLRRRGTSTSGSRRSSCAPSCNRARPSRRSRPRTTRPPTGSWQRCSPEGKKRLDAAVTSGKVTAAQEKSMLDKLKAVLTDAVNGKLPS